jgi:hypothetical protein
VQLSRISKQEVLEKVLFYDEIVLADTNDFFCVLEEKDFGVKSNFWQKKDVLYDFIEYSN